MHVSVIVEILNMQWLSHKEGVCLLYGCGVGVQCLTFSTDNTSKYEVVTPTRREECCSSALHDKYAANRTWLSGVLTYLMKQKVVVLHPVCCDGMSGIGAHWLILRSEIM